ncbi:hypothetical protein HMPREF2811_06805 [Globicatella sp. HMSC072A10]|uniref:hypothetical protein n=1 Tax=Globicatella sp. HMSC072A10 TaxID=1739315 RepID=UPI0008BA23F0|nr:hypothetical protein [Globicatella sp. HMSC072A10]OFK57064.1 hypothetical protein HMPREF2811_06805 [Globicatella sp. HMSC072A10]
MIKVYQSETDSYKEMECIGKVRYEGETFGVICLTDGQVYDVVGIEPDYLRVVDDSEEDYLYPIINPRPTDGSSKGGRWVLVEDYFCKLIEVFP